jgi:hypothetical protein
VYIDHLHSLPPLLFGLSGAPVYLVHLVHLVYLALTR